MELLEEINAQGTTIVMVTHDPELAARAQRNVHIVDGQVTDLRARAGRCVAPRAAGRDRLRSTPCSPTTSTSALRSLAPQPGADRADGRRDRGRHRARA